jgi:DNA-binding NarL/FixJ family response regulator
MIYMVDCQSAALASMRPLLEASGRPVMEVADADSFSHDVLARRTVRACDALILDLDGGDAPLYRLLNLVMRERERPRIVLMAGSDAPLGDTDRFAQDRLHVLRHPASPKALLDLLGPAA